MSEEQTKETTKPKRDYKVLVVALTILFFVIANLCVSVIVLISINNRPNFANYPRMQLNNLR